MTDWSSRISERENFASIESQNYIDDFAGIGDAEKVSSKKYGWKLQFKNKDDEVLEFFDL